jgi:uncharacterized protein
MQAFTCIMSRRAETDRDGAEDAGMATFAVFTAKGPHWNRQLGIREQAGWTEHAAFADGLVDQGVTVLGGPIETGDPEVVALLLVNGNDEQEVRAAFAPDPWWDAGILRVRDVYPWTLWLDSR